MTTRNSHLCLYLCLEALELSVNDPFYIPLGTTASLVAQTRNPKPLSTAIGFESTLPIIVEAMRSSPESIDTILLSCWMSNPERMSLFDSSNEY